MPVRVEVGPRDVQQSSCVVSRRDQPGKAGKQFGVPLEPETFVSHVKGLLQEIQQSLYDEVRLASADCRSHGKIIQHAHMHTPQLCCLEEVFPEKHAA